MIVNKEQRNLQVSEALQRQHVTVKASAEVVRRVILPYTKFALAAVRETINNAADASSRLDIQAPNTLDPTFRLRDYGPGIPQTQMVTFYREAGYSTKTQTNVNVLEDGTEVQVMGCKGVGRFAPLGVTDEFIIRNFNNGECLTGRVYFNDEAMPTFDIIDRSPSDEPSGVEISFAIDPRKTSEFIGALKQVLSGFEETYQINWLGEPVEIPKLTAKFQGNGWWIGPGPGLLMGRIIYNVDPGFFVNEDYDIYLLFNYGKLVLRVPLGSIDVNDAREQVINNDKLIATVKTALNTLKTELVDKVNHEISTAATYWEACARFREIADRQLHGRLGTKGAKWNGKPVDVDVTYDLSGLTPTNPDGSPAGTPASVPVYPTWELRSRKRPKGQYRVSGSIAPDCVIFILNDKPRKLVERLNNWLNNDSDVQIKLSDINVNWRREGYVFVIPQDKEAVYLDAFGNPPVFAKASDIPDLPVTAKSATPRAPVSVKIMDPSKGDWVPGQPSLNDDKVTYLEYNAGSRITSLTETEHPTAIKLLAMTNIYAVRTLFGRILPVIVRIDASNKRLIAKSKWRPFTDWLEDLAKQLVADQVWLDRVRLHKYVMSEVSVSNPNRLLYEHRDDLGKLVPALKALPDCDHYNEISRFVCMQTDLFTRKLCEGSTHVKTLAKVVDDHPLLPYILQGDAPQSLVKDYLNRWNR